MFLKWMFLKWMFLKWMFLKSAVHFGGACQKPTQGNG